MVVSKRSGAEVASLQFKMEASIDGDKISEVEKGGSVGVVVVVCVCGGAWGGGGGGGNSSEAISHSWRIPSGSVSNSASPAWLVGWAQDDPASTRHPILSHANHPVASRPIDPHPHPDPLIPIRPPVRFNCTRPDPFGSRPYPSGSSLIAS